MSPLRYYPAAFLDRSLAFKPVARLRERVIALGAPRAAGVPDDGLPLPPAALRVLVAGTGDPDVFMASSVRGAEVVERALTAAGRELTGTVLDFGCGCGRVARRWRARDFELHGCDYNERLVEWCRRNLPFMQAAVNPADPPAPYPDAAFDVIYALSIVTHLTEARAARWVADWRRLLRPGGTLVVTTIGDEYAHQLNDAQRARYEAGEAVVVKPRVEGLNVCVAHTPRPHVERVFADWSQLAFLPGGPRFGQDAYVFSPPSGP
jgi:SAM-dependent methyltransferase